jgi:class 3 adenylate cyclase
VDIAVWLESLGLGQYARAFQDNAVDSALLPALTAENLRDIGVSAVGHRRRLLEAIAALRAASGDEMPAPPTAEAAGERRRVAVLFADLAGYTALSTRLDAEEVHALLGAFFEHVDRIVVAHGGHVDKHIGDCVMAVFGAPLAHGNDAARAAAAALAIQDAMPELARALGQPVGVHIGLAGGQVVASGTGSTAHHEYTVTGETVNLASRLADAAAPGEILIAEAVRRELAERIEAAAVGDLAVKGFAEPVTVWRLLGLHAAVPARPLAGRHGELLQLAAILAEARDSGHGRTVLLRGEAGIGKTRLVEEVQRLAQGAGFACHAALVLDFGTATGRDAIRALVRGLLGVEVASDADAAGAAAAWAVDTGLVARDDTVYLNDLLNLPQPTSQRALYDAMDNVHRN